MTDDASTPATAPRGLAGWLAGIELVLGSAAALLLVAMTLLTAVDVVGRYFLNRPLTGAFELTELAMGALVFFSLPLVTLRRQQVSVDLLAGAVPQRWRRAQRTLLDVLAAACLAVIAWQLWLKAIYMAEVGETTATLGIPMYPLVYTMAVLAAVTVALMVVMALGDATGVLEGHP